MSQLQALVLKLRNKIALIGVIGLGYVGLPLTLCFADRGYRVLGFDIDPDKVARLNRGASYIERISDASVAAARNAGFEATTDFARCAQADALIICVPTPLTDHREPDLSFVIGTLESTLPYLRAGQIISLESTTYPGTTEEVLRPRIESAGLAVGEDVFLCFSPEREDPGNSASVIRAIPKVCGGCTPACLEAGLALYGLAIDCVVPVSSTRVAEMSKLLENIHRAVNIGLVNEMKMIADKMDIDIHEVIRAASTKPFGFVPYYPGPGLGGHCIPVDPFYLAWKAREYGVDTRFIELAGEINHAMPHWVMAKITAAMNARRKTLNGSRALVLGIAYKKNVDDLRESPAVELMSLLRDQGAQVDYSDPHVPVFPRIRKYHFELRSVLLTPGTLAHYDFLLLATNHDKFDYALIRKHAQLIIDTRGVYLDPGENIVRA